jgi:uncharacterized protein (TIGR03086 family)
MTSTADLYETTRSSLESVLDAVPAAGWDAASPCAGWTARDVLQHMVETQRDFLQAHGVDLGAVPDLGPDPAAAWRGHAKRVAEALSDETLTGTPYDGHFGPTTVGATVEQFYLWDMVVHRWDIARAAGRDTGFSDAELDRLEAGADSFGPALYMDGICRPGVDAPADADRTTQLLARLGRQA